ALAHRRHLARRLRARVGARLGLASRVALIPRVQTIARIEHFVAGRNDLSQQSARIALRAKPKRLTNNELTGACRLQNDAPAGVLLSPLPRSCACGFQLQASPRQIERSAPRDPSRDALSPRVEIAT